MKKALTKIYEDASGSICTDEVGNLNQRSEIFKLCMIIDNTAKKTKVCKTVLDPRAAFTAVVFPCK